jgi:hypothetical protein
VIAGIALHVQVGSVQSGGWKVVPYLERGRPVARARKVEALCAREPSMR